MKLKINARLLLTIILTTSLIYAAAIGYITISMRNKALDDAKELTDTYAGRAANAAKIVLNEDMTVTRALAQAFMSYDIYSSFENRREIFTSILTNVFNENPKYVSVWLSLELNAIDSSYTKLHGRYRTEIFTTNGNVTAKHMYMNMDKEDEGMYYKIKISPSENFTNPYWYSYTDVRSDSILMSSSATPIIRNDHFVGLAGLDVPLSRFQEITDAIKPFENSYAFMCANNGSFVAHPNQTYINRSISDINPEDNEKYRFGEKIRNGEAVSFVRDNKDGTKSYVTFAPIFIGKTTTPWSIGIIVPLDEIMKEANKNFQNSIWIASIGLAFLAFVVWLISRYISKPLIKISEILQNLAKGLIDEKYKMTVKTKDEIGEIRKSVNTLIDALKQTAEFAGEIGKGNLSAEFSLLSNEDMLGKALYNMRQSLKQAKLDEEERNKENNRQAWLTKGYAQIGELLRKNYEDMEKFSYSIISTLVKYIEADQGGMFLKAGVEDNDTHLQLMAAFAFGSEKLSKKRIEIGENLVGMSVMQKEIINISSIPENYIITKSGLGKHKPSNLLIVPLRFNDDIFGAFEIASFHAFKPYQIEFIEKVGESTASTVSTIQLNLRTAKLLEESKKKSKELADNEIFMQQNMKQLISAQKEAAKQTLEMQNLLDAINSISFVAEYDMNGRITNVNSRLLEFFNLKREDLIGKKQGQFEISGEGKKRFDKMWDDLRKGISTQTIQHTQIGGKDIWLSESYTPIYDENGVPYKVLNIAIDITGRQMEEIQKKP